MHFTSSLTTTIIAVAIIASPISGFPTLSKRQDPVDLCDYHVPCRVQQQIDDCFNDANSAQTLANAIIAEHYDDAGIPQVTAQLSLTASGLVSTANYLSAYIPNLAESDVAQFKQNVTQTITDEISEIRATAANIVVGVGNVSDTVSSAAASVTAGITAIANIVGYCG